MNGLLLHTTTDVKETVRFRSDVTDASLSFDVKMGPICPATDASPSATLLPNGLQSHLGAKSQRRHF